jgi:hypothetical protein
MNEGSACEEAIRTLRPASELRSDTEQERQ